MIAFIKRLLELWAAFRAGKKAQQSDDRNATLDALLREREAQNRAPGTIDQMAEDARRGKL